MNEKLFKNGLQHKCCVISGQISIKEKNKISSERHKKKFHAFFTLKVIKNILSIHILHRIIVITSYTSSLENGVFNVATNKDQTKEW